MLFKCTKILQGFASSPFLKPPPPIKKIQPPLPPPKINKNISLQDKSNTNKNFLNNNATNVKIIEKMVQPEATEMYQPRKKSAVVTIMGHVDHGKTTLIDFLRKSNIADKQHGGITQKIGAFHIQCHGQKITFIDTPGHEAFFSMRQRGAAMTDVIVLIVSAVEGVKKQTVQIIKLINQKNIKTIVAINKLDLPNADPQQVQKNLYDAGLNLQSMGGTIPVVHISAKTGQNVPLLSELILQETKQLKAIYEGNVEGAVLQANKNHEGLNSMTMIIQRGTLKPGSILIVGDQFTKVKYMHDDKGNNLTQGIPGDAVQIVGVPIVPKAGQFVYQVSDQKKAKFIVQKKKQQTRKTQSQGQDPKLQSTKIKLKNRRQRKAFCRGFSERWLNHYKQTEQNILLSLQQLKSKPETPQLLASIQLKQQELKTHRLYVQEYLMNSKQKASNLNLILKFSDRGIEQTILQQMEETVQNIKKKYGIDINVLKTDIGDISLGDLKQAKMANAQIITFGVDIDPEASEMISESKIYPKCHNLIHSFLKQLQQTSFQRKRNSIKGVQKGNAEVCEVYTLKKGKKNSFNAIGIRVKNGKMQKKNAFVLFRQGIPISQPMYADSIKIYKKQSLQVKKGEECCVTFGQNQKVIFQKGDQIYSYQM